MQFLGILMPLMGLLAVAGWIWLVVVAFKRSPLWGVLVLLLSPISAIVFAIKYWAEAKRPFFVYGGGLAACCAVLALTLVAAGAGMLQVAAVSVDEGLQAARADDDIEETDGAELAHEDGPAMAERAQPDVAEGTTVPRGGGDESASLPASSSSREERASRFGAGRDVVALREVEQHVGETLRVVTADGMEFVGEYVGRDGQRFEFERRISSGTLAIYLAGNEVRSLHRVRQR